MLDRADLYDAAQVLRDMLVWDNHSCMPLRPDDASFLPELAQVRGSGVDVIALNVGFGPIDAATHFAMLDGIAGWIAARPEQYRLVRTVADIAAARAAGQLGILFDVEGMGPLDGGHIERVEMFRRAGVGWMLIAYNNANDAGGGCVDPDAGLTAYGHAVLDEMKRVGMIVCCSHTGHRTALDVMERAGNPVIFSHSNPSALYTHYRNIPDELMRACARTGGVVGINGVGIFLSDDGQATPMRIAEHVDYAVQLIGPDHVGIALDYVYDRQELLEHLEKMRATFPDDASLVGEIDFFHPSRLVEVVAQLTARGYGRADLAGILGGNWLRVASQVWRPD